MVMYSCHVTFHGIYIIGMEKIRVCHYSILSYIFVFLHRKRLMTDETIDSSLHSSVMYDGNGNGTDEIY